MLDHIGTPIILVDSDLSVRYANIAAKRVMDLSPAQKVSKPVLEYIHSDDRDEIRSKLNELVTTPDSSFEYEFQF